MVSQGGIRGHAASPDAVTVGSVKICTDGADTPATLAFSDDACALEAEPFTAGGQYLFQYGWQYDSTSNTWGEYIGASTDGNRPARNPNVVAVGSTVVVAPDQAGAASELAYAGTSVSAAAVAGMAALYWEHRETELANFVPPVDEGIRNQVLPDEVRAALRDAARRDPTSPFDLAQSLILGDGAIDAPFALENTLSDNNVVRSINPIAGVGSVRDRYHESGGRLQGGVYILGSMTTDFLLEGQIPTRRSVTERLFGRQITPRMQGKTTWISRRHLFSRWLLVVKSPVTLRRASIPLSAYRGHLRLAPFPLCSRWMLNLFRYNW